MKRLHCDLIRASIGDLDHDVNKRRQFGRNLLVEKLSGQVVFLERGWRWVALHARRFQREIARIPFIIVTKPVSMV